jgi:hypothetical protein
MNIAESLSRLPRKTSSRETLLHSSQRSHRIPSGRGSSTRRAAIAKNLGVRRATASASSWEYPALSGANAQAAPTVKAKVAMTTLKPLRKLYKPPP